MNEFKNAVYQTAISQLKQKEALLAEERKNIIESILEEEKNSAGDKYETSRETMTQDLNSLEKQIKPCWPQRDSRKAESRVRVKGWKI